MNKTFLTIIMFLSLINAKGQNMKVVILEKTKDFYCMHNAEQFRIDSIIANQGKLCLSNALKKMTLGINDDLWIEDRNYKIVLLQPKIPPVLRGEEIDYKIKTSAKPKIPASVGIYSEHILASCMANNSSPIKFKSTIYDIIWLLPLGDENRFFAERIRPKKYRKLFNKI